LGVTLEDQEKRMRRTRGRAGLAPAAVALGLLAWVAPGADAAPMKESAKTFVTYNSTGSVGLSGITGKNVVSFKVAGGSFTAPSAFSLGEFLVDGLAAGETTTYTNTPFSISYLAKEVDGVDPVPNETPITLTGVLNGSFNGPDQSSVVATFDPVINEPFQTGQYINELSILGDAVLLVPSTTNGGRTTVQAQIIANSAPVPAPEPASVAVFLAAAAGLGLYRRRARVRPA